MVYRQGLWKWRRDDVSHCYPPPDSPVLPNPMEDCEGCNDLRGPAPNYVRYVRNAKDPCSTPNGHARQPMLRGIH